MVSCWQLQEKFSVRRDSSGAGDAGLGEAAEAQAPQLLCSAAPLCLGLWLRDLSGESQPESQETCPGSHRNLPQALQSHVGLFFHIVTI